MVGNEKKEEIKSEQPTKVQPVRSANAPEQMPNSAQMPAQKKIEFVGLPVALIDNILKYLSKQSWDEADPLIQAIRTQGRPVS